MLGVTRELGRSHSNRRKTGVLAPFLSRWSFIDNRQSLLALNVRHPPREADVQLHEELRDGLRRTHVEAPAPPRGDQAFIFVSIECVRPAGFGPPAIPKRENVRHCCALVDAVTGGLVPRKPLTTAAWRGDTTEAVKSALGGGWIPKPLRRMS